MKLAVGLLFVSLSLLIKLLHLKRTAFADNGTSECTFYTRHRNASSHRYARISRYDLKNYSIVEKFFFAFYCVFAQCYYCVGQLSVQQMKECNSAYFTVEVEDALCFENEYKINIILYAAVCVCADCAEPNIFKNSTI